MTRLRFPQTGSMALSSGAYFSSHSTVSQWLRAAKAASVALLAWIGPLQPEWLSRSTSVGLLEQMPDLFRREGVENRAVRDLVAAALGRG